MGKVSPKDRNPKTRKRLRGSSNKYLKPGTLGQVRVGKSIGSKSCTYIGRKRVAVSDTQKVDSDLGEGDTVIDMSPLVLSPVNLVKQSNLISTPKTPRLEDCESESRLESLPMDLLVIFNRLCLVLLIIYVQLFFTIVFLIKLVFYIWFIEVQ